MGLTPTCSKAGTFWESCHSAALVGGNHPKAETAPKGLCNSLGVAQQQEL